MRRGRIPELGLLLLGYQLIQNIGLTSLPPVTLVSILLQVAIYLNIVNVPRLCISGNAVALDREYVRLVVPAVRHTHDIHLYYNMVSLAWKGLELERRLGSARFLVTLVLLTLSSSVMYVMLAMAGADVLEDPGLMSQCAIGFSGVLFALKVVNMHYSNTEHHQTSFFGWLVPLKMAVWLELVIIQVMVPNSSFIGHMGGILAGLLLVKTPLAAVLGLQPSWQERRVSSSPTTSFISSIIPRSLLTILICILQACLFLGVFPNLRPFTGCIHYLHILDSNISLNSIKTLLLSPLHHLSVVHLLINLVSLYMKGRSLEPKIGKTKFLKTLLLSLVGSVTSHTVLSLVSRLAEVSWPVDTCVGGLSAAMFSLKVVTLANTSSLDTGLLYELAELVMLAERNSRLYHVSGLVTGVVLVLWCDCTSVWPRSSGGQVLGHGQQPAWTRSWGYAGYIDDEDEQYQEALRQSRQEYEQSMGRSYTPSAPPAEADMVPDMVGVRPPLYAQVPAPPPPGQAYRMQSTESPPSFMEEDDLRRRRLERFS